MLRQTVRSIDVEQAVKDEKTDDKIEERTDETTKEKIVEKIDEKTEAKIEMIEKEKIEGEELIFASSANGILNGNDNELKERNNEGELVDSVSNVSTVQSSSIPTSTSSVPVRPSVGASPRLKITVTDKSNIDVNTAAAASESSTSTSSTYSCSAFLTDADRWPKLSPRDLRSSLTSRVLVCTKGENDHQNTLSKRNRLGQSLISQVCSRQDL